MDYKKIFIFLLTIYVSVSLYAQNIIEWRNDRTGIYSNEKGLLKSWPPEGPKLLWHVDGLGEGHSSVSIASDKLYTTGMIGGKGFLFVISREGKLLNKVMYGDEWNESYVGTRATPVVNDGKIYLMSGKGDLVCLDEKSLNTVWSKKIFVEFKSKNIRWGFCESPLIIDEKLIITPGGKEYNVVALNKNTGKLIWSSPGVGDLSAYCSPLYINDQEIPLIVTKTADHIIGLEATTGKLLWSMENKNRNAIHANTPVYANNMILTASVDKGATMLRLSNGGRKVEKVWEVPGLDNMMGALMKTGNYIYGSSSGDRTPKLFFCVDWMTGEIKYKEASIGVGVTIFADGLLYFYSDRGIMALIKPTPDKFDLISKFPITLGTDTHWAHPVIYQGVLYLRHGDCLMAYKVN